MRTTSLETAPSWSVYPDIPIGVSAGGEQTYTAYSETLTGESDLSPSRELYVAELRDVLGEKSVFAAMIGDTLPDVNSEEEIDALHKSALMDIERLQALEAQRDIEILLGDPEVIAARARFEASLDRRRDALPGLMRMMNFVEKLSEPVPGWGATVDSNYDYRAVRDYTDMRIGRNRVSIRRPLEGDDSDACVEIISPDGSVSTMPLQSCLPLLQVPRPTVDEAQANSRGYLDRLDAGTRQNEEYLELWYWILMEDSDVRIPHLHDDTCQRHRSFGCQEKGITYRWPRFVRPTKWGGDLADIPGIDRLSGYTDFNGYTSSNLHLAAASLDGESGNLAVIFVGARGNGVPQRFTRNIGDVPLHHRDHSVTISDEGRLVLRVPVQNSDGTVDQLTRSILTGGASDTSVPDKLRQDAEVLRQTGVWSQELGEWRDGIVKLMRIKRAIDSMANEYRP